MFKEFIFFKIAWSQKFSNWEAVGAAKRPQKLFKWRIWGFRQFRKTLISWTPSCLTDYFGIFQKWRVSQFLIIFHDFHNFSQFFGGSFSSVSTPIFTIKGAFCSIFRDLQNDLLNFPNSAKFSKNFAKIRKKVMISKDFQEFLQNFTIFCRFLWYFAFF